MHKPFIKSLATGLSVLLLAPAAWSAAPKCSKLFIDEEPVQTAPKKVELKYEATNEEVAELYAQYPKYLALIEATVANLDASKPSSYVSPISKVTEMQGVRGASTGSDWNSPAKMEALPASLKKQIVDVHNLLLDSQAMKDYVVELMNDIGVLMMKEKDRETFGRTDLNQPLSTKTDVKIRKEEFLLAGTMDRNSMLKVLVNRVRARGDEITIILDGSKGGYNGNQTKTQKYVEFWEVPRRGPFFDKYFGAGSSHGQEKHLLQMDFIERALKPTNRRQFWDYITTTGKGSWAWDTLIDGMNSTYMHPEFIGPILNRTLPLL